MLLFLGMGYEVLKDQISMKEYIVFYSYMGTFTSNFMTVIQMLTTLQPTLLNVRRIIGVIESEDEVREKAMPLETVEFVNADKAFGENVLFSNVNLKLDLKESHAILGMNGSGKTTFAKMLIGEEATSKGALLIDGCPMEKLQKEDMRGVCYYAAKPSVFSGMTLRDNLLLGTMDKTVSDSKLQEICKDFLFGEDVAQMQNGFDTVLGNEVQLSSGQMKKVELVRAAMGDAEVIILDEPMANLDEEFRKHFQSVYEKYFAHRKVFVVEHDKRRVSFADKVLEIGGGAIRV